MRLRPDEVRKHAEALAFAKRHRNPIAPLSSLVPGLDVESAYEIQRHNVEQCTSNGRRVVGHKVGLTSLAMQQLLGVNEPDFGVLFDDMVYQDNVELNARDFCQPRIEPEIAMRLGSPLVGPGVSVDDVSRAVVAVAPALELVDSRIRNWEIQLVDTIADNASSAGVVLGTWLAMDEVPRLRDVSVELSLNGHVVEEGSGEAVLGDPFLAVAWLANTVSQFGVELQPDHVVLPGAMTSAPFVASGDSIVAQFSEMGSVTAVFS